VRQLGWLLAVLVAAALWPRPEIEVVESSQPISPTPGPSPLLSRHFRFQVTHFPGPDEQEVNFTLEGGPGGGDYEASAGQRNLTGHVSEREAMEFLLADYYSVVESRPARAGGTYVSLSGGGLLGEERDVTIMMPDEDDGERTCAYRTFLCRSVVGTSWRRLQALPRVFDPTSSWRI